MAEGKKKTGNPMLDNPEPPVDTLKRVMKKDEAKKAAEAAKKAEVAEAKKAAVEAKKVAAEAKKAAEAIKKAEAATKKAEAVAEAKRAAETAKAAKKEKAPKPDKTELNAMVEELNLIKTVGVDHISILTERVNEIQAEVNAAKKKLRDDMHAFVEANPLLKNVRLPKRVGNEYRPRPARREDGLTVKKVILEGLKGGFPISEIVLEIKKHFPDSNAGVNDIHWYSNRIKHGHMDAEGNVLKK
jgi:hypothetical protein